MIRVSVAWCELLSIEMSKDTSHSGPRHALSGVTQHSLGDEFYLLSLVVEGLVVSRVVCNA